MESDELQSPSSGPKMDGDDGEKVGPLPVRIKHQIDIPPRWQFVCTATQEVINPEQDIMVEPVQVLAHGILVARSISKAKREINICILNVSSNTVTIPKNTVVAYSEEIEMSSEHEIIDQMNCVETYERSNITTHVDISHLAENGQGNLGVLLEKYSDIFMDKGSKEQVVHVNRLKSATMTKKAVLMKHLKKVKMRCPQERMEVMMKVINNRRKEWKTVGLIRKNVEKMKNLKKMCMITLLIKSQLNH